MGALNLQGGRRARRASCTTPAKPKQKRGQSVQDRAILGRTGGKNALLDEGGIAREAQIIALLGS